MKLVNDLMLGFNDAEDYRRSENRRLFNDVFVKDYNLEKLLQLNTFFLIGEKGTGKTAYAVYLANNEYKNTRSQLTYIRETEYKRFIKLKELKHLEFSDYTTIWKVILLVLIATNIEAKDIDSAFSKNSKLENVHKAINSYYVKGFSPEISTIMELVVNSKLAAELFTNFANVSAGKTKQSTFSETTTQLNLLNIYRELCSAISDLRLSRNQFLFIDGIDIRPEGIQYREYLACIKGLAEATWELNNDVFPPIKGSKGRIKIVLLLRPDIMTSIGLQNTMNKITNNTVYLDWRTTYPEHRNSKLFSLSEKLLSHQQEDELKNLPAGSIWDQYFP
ncbi:MAG: funZ protein, partial [Clostridia bacterium]